MCVYGNMYGTNKKMKDNNIFLLFTFIHAKFAILKWKWRNTMMYRYCTKKNEAKIKYIIIKRYQNINKLYNDILCTCGTLYTPRYNECTLKGISFFRYNVIKSRWKSYNIKTLLFFFSSSFTSKTSLFHPTTFFSTLLV